MNGTLRPVFASEGGPPFFLLGCRISATDHALEHGFALRVFCDFGQRFGVLFLESREDLTRPTRPDAMRAELD